MPKPYYVKISATDCLGTLKTIPYVFNDISGSTGYQSELGILKNALSFTGLSLNIVTAVNTIHDGMDVAGPDKSPVDKTYLNNRGFKKADGTNVSCYEVIRSSMERMSCRLFQWDNEWVIANVLEQSSGPIDATRFDTENVFVEDFELGNEVTVGNVDDNDNVAPDGGVINIEKAFLYSTARYKYGYPTNQVYNGDMDIWLSKPSGLPDGWAVTGGVTAEGGIRLVDGVETTDYYIIIHDDSPTGYLYNTTNTQIRANDRATIRFDWYAPEAYDGFGGGPAVINVIIHDVTADIYFTNNGWQDDFGIYVATYQRSQLKSQFTTTIDVQAQETDYQLSFGIRNVTTLAGQFELQINNVAISPGISNAQIKPGIAIYNKQIQNSKQSYTKDDIEVIHGDEPLDTLRTSGILIDADGSFIGASSWSRKGYAEDEGILHIMANSELVNHQRPYRSFESNFINAYRVTISPFTLLTIDLLPDMKFIFLSGTFRLKEGEHELLFAEALTAVVTPADEEQKEVYDE